MTYDYGKLRGRIVEICGTATKLCKAIGMKYNTFSDRIHNRKSFTQGEIDEIAKVLKISPNEIGDYFFKRIYMN